MREIIREIVLNKLYEIPSKKIPRLCKELSESELELVDPETTTCDDIVEDFTTAINFQSNPSEIISYCTVLFRAIESIPGPCKSVISVHLKQNLKQAIKDEFNVDVNFDS